MWSLGCWLRNSHARKWLGFQLGGFRAEDSECCGMGTGLTCIYGILIVVAHYIILTRNKEHVVVKRVFAGPGKENSCDNPCQHTMFNRIPKRKHEYSQDRQKSSSLCSNPLRGL